MVALICCFGTTVPRLMRNALKINSRHFLLSSTVLKSPRTPFLALTIKSIRQIPLLKAKRCKNGHLRVYKIVSPLRATNDSGTRRPEGRGHFNICISPRSLAPSHSPLTHHSRRVHDGAAAPIEIPAALAALPMPDIVK